MGFLIKFRMVNRAFFFESYVLLGLYSKWLIVTFFIKKEKNKSYVDSYI